MKPTIVEVTDGRQLAETVSHCFECGRKIETDEQCHYFEDNRHSPKVRIAVFCGKHIPQNEQAIRKWAEIDMESIPMESFIEAMKFIKEW